MRGRPAALRTAPPPVAPARGARALLAAIAIGVFAFALTLPLMEDDFQVLYWARASTLVPSCLFEPWYGGVLGRVVAKLLLMLGMALFGPRHEAFQLMGLLLHAASVLLLERLVRSWTGSRRIAFLAALLFAVGFGSYGKAVIRPNNLSMGLALALTLWAFVEWQARHRVRALLLWILALGSHEAVALAPLVAAFTPGPDPSAGPRSERWRTGLVLGGIAVMALAVLLPGRAGLAAAILAQLPAFALMPINAGPAQELSAHGVTLPRTLVDLLTVHRTAVGLALILPVAFAVPRSRGLRLAVAWMYLFWLPATILMSGWGPGTWLEPRYLHPPAIGFCLLAACVLDRIPWRAARGLLLTGFLAWTLCLDALVWVKHIQRWRVGPPDWRQRSAAFRQEMEDLERTHVPLRVEPDSTQAR